MAAEGSEVANLAPVLEQAQAHGLARPGDEALRRVLQDEAARNQGATQEELRRRAILYASDQHAGRAKPSSVDQRWALQPEPLNPEAEFERARAEGRLDAWLTSLPPAHAEYR
ncbi:MAG TPA: hypothetical protein VIO94_15125, partial [Phenylobacterium sp.]